MNQMLLLALLAKLTLVILLGSAIAVLLRNRSAATRHFVWTLTLCSTLTIGIAALIAPPVTLPIPYTIEQPTAVTPTIAVPQTTNHELRATDPAPRTPLPEPRSPIHPLAILWLAGFVSVLTWLVAGHAGLARIARTAIAPEGDEWRALIGETGNVRVAVSPAVSAPVTWGWLRPLVLFPAGANTWPVERRRAALLHELAHVARRDYLIQIVAAFVCAVYWFHPLVWLAVHRLRSESEHASDDQVLSTGAEAPEYAEHLLEVARGAVGRRLCNLPAVDMAHPSNLESRVRAVLDGARTRSFVPRRTRFALAAIVTLILVPLAAARPELRAGEDLLQPILRAANVKVSKPFHPSEEHVATASPGGVLELDFDAGSTVDIRGWDEPQVRVRSQISGVDGPDARVSFDNKNGVVTVRTAYDASKPIRSSSIRMEIRVPRRFDMRIESSGGGITIADVEGRFTGNTAGGEIVLERVKGEARLSTGGGEIRVDDVDLDGHVSTGGGKVTLSRVRGGLTGSSGSGPVMYRKTDRGEIGDIASSEGNLHMEKAGGEIVLREAPNGASVSTGGGDIEIGRGAGLVEASTGGGDIRIGPIAGSVTAGTGAGRVEITLIDANGAEQNVDVTTGRGRVVLELPANLDARFELETAFTVNSSRRTQIISDWELTQEEVTRELDAREGTPRRYVRGRGTAGSGRGLIRVKAVNGDIFVRRAK